jgi:VCBS repeat-containing protein
MFEHLNTGETAIDSFAYTVDDGEGGMDTEIVTLTITGSDDFLFA